MPSAVTPSRLVLWRRPSLHAAALGTILAVLLGGSAWLLLEACGRLPPPWQVAAVNWETIPANETETKAESLAPSRAGRNQLLAALACSRSEVSAAAGNALAEELLRWRLLSPAQAQAEAEAFSDRLAQEANRCTPQGRREATRLALQLLALTLDPALEIPPDRAKKIVAACETVIRVGGSDLLAARETPNALHANDANDASAGRLGSVIGGGDSEKSPASPERFHGQPDEATPKGWRGLPAELTSTPNLLAIPRAKPLASDGQATPEDASPSGPGVAENSSPGETRNRNVPGGARLMAPHLTGDASRGSPGGNSTPANPKFDGSPDWGSLNDLEAIRLLESDDDSLRRGAAEELTARGFGPHLSRARRLASRRREDRLELLAELPRTAGLDVVPWLLWLSEDGDPEVRRQAAALMATSSSPRLLRRVEEMGLSETDERVRQSLQRSSLRR